MGNMGVMEAGPHYALNKNRQGCRSDTSFLICMTCNLGEDKKGVRPLFKK